MDFLKRLRARYSDPEIAAMVSLVAIMIWAWGYFVNRHIMSERFGHGSYQILGASGIIIFILLIIKGIPKSNISCLKSFRWAYVASFGLCAIALLNTASTSDCPDRPWPDCPPANIDDMKALMVYLGQPGQMPPVYRHCYNMDNSNQKGVGIPLVTKESKCKVAPTDEPGKPGDVYEDYLKYEVNGIKEDFHVYYDYDGVEVCQYPHPTTEPHDWPPSNKCWDLSPSTLIGPLVWMAFLVPLVGMVFNWLPNLCGRTMQFVLGLIFIVFLVWLYWWPHAVPSFYLGRPWSEFNHAYDYTVPMVFFPAAIIHLFSASLAYCKFKELK